MRGEPLCPGKNCFSGVEIRVYGAGSLLLAGKGDIWKGYIIYGIGICIIDIIPGLTGG